MATTTTNLGLTKPAVSDAADISVLNANFDKIDEKCNPALFASAYVFIESNLETAGWYKIGTIQPSTNQFITACRMSIGGGYYYDEPPSALIDIISNFSKLTAKVTVPSPVTTGIAKVGFVRTAMKIFDVYVYYNPNRLNRACIKVDMLQGDFAKHNFESSTVSESDMMEVVSINECSFAPAGYGLGMTRGRWVDITTIDDLDNLKANGWYSVYVTSSSLTIEGVAFNALMLEVSMLSDYFGWQTARLLTDNCILRRKYVNGTWQPWEWVNPPMVLGVEYRTTERRNGKAVYTMLFDCGEAAVSTKQVTIPGVPAAANIFRYSGNMNDSLPLPHYYSYPDVVLEVHFNQSSAANEKYCIVHGSTNYTASNVKVQIWYTKP